MKPEREYIIFCDESLKHGRFYSNFYGGVLVGASQYEKVTNRLELKKRELNLFGEVKWEKVTERYRPKYEALIHQFFDELRANRLKVRIMFRQNAHQAGRLTSQQREDEYFLFYYQFLKHAFGLLRLPPAEPYQRQTRLRLYFDEFPEKPAKVAVFRRHLMGLQTIAAMRDARLQIAAEDIAEVRSHDHVLLQCLDVVLGAMAFRLDDRHQDKPEGLARRGKRTVAKEKLYKMIRGEICTLRPNFNCGANTGIDGDVFNYWRHSYRHWNFIPAELEIDETQFKLRPQKQAKENPTGPTSISDA